MTTFTTEIPTWKSFVDDMMSSAHVIAVLARLTNGSEAIEKSDVLIDPIKVTKDSRCIPEKDSKMMSYIWHFAIKCKGFRCTSSSIMATEKIVKHFLKITFVNSYTCLYVFQ